MALAHSPKITTDGLVFAYDMGNTQKSWKGAPVTNLAVYTDYSNRNYDTLYDIGGFGGDDADVFYYRNGGYNNLPYKKMVKHTGGTGGSYINEHSYFTLVEGTTYIITCYMKSNAVTTVSGHTLALNRDSDNAYRVPADIALTTDWVKQSWTYTCAVGEGGTTYHFRQIVYNDTSLPVEVYWCGLQISVGTVSYPYVNGARSNTQALVDLMGSNTITASSLTYAVDNTFSFNGSTNFVTTTNTGLTHGITNFSYSCWASWSSKPGYGTLFENGTWTSSLIIRFESNGITIYSMGTYYGKFTVDPTLNTWYHMFFIRNGNSIDLYVNGVYHSAIAFGTSVNIIPNTNLIYIGMSQHAAGQCFSGKIAAAHIYNRALTSVEVQQNFNALRGRYGV